MPRYYFHVKDGRDFPDLQGTLLPDISAAKDEAIRFVGDLLARNSAGFWSGRDWTVRVTDSDDVELFDLNFIAALKPPAITD